MKYDDLFVSDEIPERLSNREIVVLFDRMKQGDMTAREELISHNIGLVIQCVKNNFMDVDYDKRELVSVGCMGLIRAVDTYDISKGNYYFSLRASICISREIKGFLKELNKDSVISYDEIFDNGIELKDIIPSEMTVAEEYEEKDYDDYIYGLLEDSMKYLSERDRKIVMLRMGFYNNKKYTCRELASMMNLTRVRICQILCESMLILRCKIKELDSDNSNILKRVRDKK